MDNKLILFDIDGTLTDNEDKINDMLDALISLNSRSDIDLGIIEGSNSNDFLNKINNKKLNIFSWKLNHNGLQSYKTNIRDFMGEKHYMKFINIILKNLSKIELPKKRGTFIKYTDNMLVISPIGIECNDEEKDEFQEYDNKYLIRENLIETINRDWLNYCYYDDDSFENLNKIKFSIDGKICLNIFLEEYNKIYPLSFFKDKYNMIYYFRNQKYDNNEIFNNFTTITHNVSTYQDTIKILNSF